MLKTREMVAKVIEGGEWNVKKIVRTMQQTLLLEGHTIAAVTLAILH